MRLIKIEHNRQFPSHKISEWNSSVFGSIDFWKTPVWGLEGHTAICSSLLTSPPGQQSEVSDSSKPSVPATTHPKARSIVPKNSMEATQLLQQSRVVNKRKPEADQSNVSKLRLLTHRNNPKQFIAKPNKPTQPIKHVLLTPGLRVKALTPAPTQTSIPKRVPKVEEQSKEIVFTVGETVFVSIVEWFTLAAPCPANDAGKLFVRGDVVMSSRNSAKFTISFPQLGPFVDDSVLTRSTQYLEVRT